MPPESRVSYWCFCADDTLDRAIHAWAEDHRHDDVSAEAAADRAATVRAFLESRQARDYGLLKGAVNERSTAE